MKHLKRDLANFGAIFIKENFFDKKNYRPVSILPLLSRVYERVIYEEGSNYLESFSTL